MVKNNWSINVTTRNPNRLKNILKVLAKFEGKIFDEKIQAKFIEEVVKRGLYSPTAEIRDKSFRGRTWAGIFNALGFAKAIKTYGKVEIFPSGKELLSDDPDEEKIFLRQLVKWQLKNPSTTARGFNNFNLRPFIATLHILKETKGLSKKEFNLFIPCIKNYREIRNTANEIKKLRKNISLLKTKREKEEFFHNFAIKKVISIYNISPEKKDEIGKKLGNLKDYGDTIIRYFRYTGLVSISHQKVNLSKNRQIEINELLSEYDGSIRVFERGNKSENLDYYFRYFGSGILPLLPSEKEIPQISIIKELVEDIKELSRKIERMGIGIPKGSPNFETINPNNLGVARRNLLIRVLRGVKQKYNLSIEKVEIKEKDKLTEIISMIKKIKDKDLSIPSPSIYLEWFTCLALESINDDEEIKPNYPKDENNEPTSHAIPNKPDIEAYYKDFVLVTEVTLKTDSKQWIDEGMPVSRHVINVKNTTRKKETIGLFVAPSIHFDTRNQFFIISKYGLEGGKVPIIPITLDQFIEILEFLRKIKDRRSTKNTDLNSLLSKICDHIEISSDAGCWVDSFPTHIEKWKRELSSELNLKK